MEKKQQINFVFISVCLYMKFSILTLRSSLSLWNDGEGVWVLFSNLLVSKIAVILVKLNQEIGV